jgi:hypothetical protein
MAPEVGTGRERWTAMFGGSCPTTAQWVTTFLSADTLSGNVTVTNCNGPVSFGTTLARQ